MRLRAMLPVLRTSGSGALAWQLNCQRSCSFPPSHSSQSFQLHFPPAYILPWLRPLGEKKTISGGTTAKLSRCHSARDPARRTDSSAPLSTTCRPPPIALHPRPRCGLGLAYRALRSITPLAFHSQTFSAHQLLMGTICPM